MSDKKPPVPEWPTEDSIHARMAWLMANVPNIAKTHMPNVKYTAFAIDSLYINLRGLFGQAGVFLLPQLESIEYTPGQNKNGNAYTDVRLVVTYEFHAPDGSHVSMTVPGESRDYADKGTFQAVQQTIKYGLVQALMIATGEPDADDQKIESGAPVQQQRKSRQKPQEPEPEPEPEWSYDKAWALMYHRMGDDMAAASDAWDKTLARAGVTKIENEEAYVKVTTAMDELYPYAPGEETMT